MKKIYAFILISVLVCGCASEIRRGGAQIAYQDVDRPLKDTAVFSAIPEATQGLGQITKVDGQPTSCWQYGCPSCIRVTPGTHTFTVRYSIFNNGIASYLRGETEVTVQNMEPMHIYAARYGTLGKQFTVAVVDEGNNREFQKDRGLQGVNITCGAIDF